MPITVDAGLVEHAKQDGAAMERLAAAVWPEAYRLAWGILRDAGLAEDAAQEATSQIARSLRALKDAAAFRSWSYRIIVNAALAVARHRAATQSLGATEERGAFEDPSDAIDLYDALAALTPARRALILLHYYAGLSAKEIAMTAALPASTVRFQLMLARRALRIALSTPEERSTRFTSEALHDV
ncbi:MAG: sigma-70 family RNA polymerase sigma factor [Candidatus Cybelea sp.]